MFSGFMYVCPIFSKKRFRFTLINVVAELITADTHPEFSTGRQGCNIKDIEKKSGATIHCKKFTDKDYDVFIIRGRSEATQLAETLIHEFVKEQPTFVEDVMLVPSWACGRIIGEILQPSYNRSYKSPCSLLVNQV